MSKLRELMHEREVQGAPVHNAVIGVGMMGGVIGSDAIGFSNFTGPEGAFPGGIAATVHGVGDGHQLHVTLSLGMAHICGATAAGTDDNIGKLFHEKSSFVLVLSVFVW